jgi:hypothetical protein
MPGFDLRQAQEALGDALAPAQLRDAVLAAKAVEHDTDLLIGRILLARGSPNVLHDPLGRRLLVLGFLSHLHSLNGYDEPEILPSSTR